MKYDDFGLLHVCLSNYSSTPTLWALCELKGRISLTVLTVFR